jgi:hypothetical protein
MKFIECLQGESEWYAARCGRITASRFADAISTVGGLTEQQEQYVDAVMAGAHPKDAAAAAGYKALPTSDCVRRALLGERTEEFSDVAKRYAADLSIERISRQPHGEPFKTWVLERGHTMEEAARRQYEVRTKAFVTEAGICLTDDDLYGYSTDGLVDDDGLIEIKAPVDSVKIMTMWQTSDTAEYDDQMQGGMWVTGRAWCDFIMYVPELASVGKDLFVKRVYRDEAYISALVVRLALFEKLVSANEAMWREGAPVPPAPEDDDSLIVDASFGPDPATELAAAKQTEEGAELSPAAQALYEAEGAANFATRHPKLAAVQSPPSLRLGQIGERLGFSLTADFLRTLGFEPAAKDRAAVLYHEHQFAHICAALQRHISAVQAKQAA